MSPFARRRGVFEILAGVAVALVPEPSVFGAPVNVFFGVPDVDSTEGGTVV
jgi:hypothetical protein